LELGAQDRKQMEESDHFGKPPVRQYQIANQMNGRRSEIMKPDHAEIVRRARTVGTAATHDLGFSFGDESRYRSSSGDQLILKS
jgi:hypothetical protein